MSDDVWQVGDPAPGTKHSTLGALDPLIGTPRREPSELPAFLLARIAEDEAVARLAAQLGLQWQPGGPGVWAEATTVLASGGALPRSGRGVAEVDDIAAPHVLAWDPARVLAECDAKRRIVEDLRDELANQHDPEPTTLQLAERTLLSLALPHADHPDYREEWQP